MESGHSNIVVAQLQICNIPVRGVVIMECICTGSEFHNHIVLTLLKPNIVTVFIGMINKVTCDDPHALYLLAVYLHPGYHTIATCSYCHVIFHPHEL